MNFSLNPQKNSSLHLILLMIIAYAFSVGIRLIWVDWASGIPDFYWNNQLMINTNDGYYFASAAQKYLEGTLTSNSRVPDLFFSALITMTVAAVKTFSLPIESVILYLPVVISSLVVIPVILIGRLLGSSMIGFLAALISASAWSYYNRTMAGYFDTDMFSAMAPMFILYFLLAMIKTEKLYYALLGALAFLIYPYLYDQGRAVVYAMGIIYIAYMVFFHRKDDFTYHSVLLISIGLLNLNWAIQLILIFLVFAGIKKDIIHSNHSKYLSVLTVILFLYFGNVFGLIIGKVFTYASRGVEEEGLKFLQVKQTVREAGKIPFDVFSDRISGSVLGFLAAIVGYVFLVIRHRFMILSLPLIGIGIFALEGGLRFTVYAVPVAALSAVYLFYILGQLSDKSSFRYGIPIILSTLMLYPNMLHILDYKVPSVFNNSEVALLSDFKKHSSDKDYVITWWDYGYPLWYYANKNTLIDGGKHNQDNFIVSEILTTSSQLEAARLGRIAVETYVSSNYQIIADTLFKNHQPDQLNVFDYLEQLRYSDMTLPEKTREIYLYLPYRMLDIYPTVQWFCNRDLNTGLEKKQPFFYVTDTFQADGNDLNLGNGIIFINNEGMLKIGNQKVAVKSFHNVGYDKQNRLQTMTQMIRPDGALNIVYLPSYHRVLILDNETIDSVYMQLFLFEKYDDTLFEKVASTPYAKIYRLKL